MTTVINTNSGGQKSWIKWTRDNLFSSVSGTIQTFAFAALVVFVLRWILGLAFADDNDWTSVATNMRLMVSYNYPLNQFIRIWVAGGVLLVCAAASLGAWRFDPALTVKRMARTFYSVAVVAALCALLMPSSAPGVLVRTLWLVSVALAIAGFAASAVANKRNNLPVSFGALLTSAAVAFLLMLWFVPFGDYGVVGGSPFANPGDTVARSTKEPWTVILTLVVLAFWASRGLGVKAVAIVRSALLAFWLVGPALLIFVVLRDPAFDWQRVWGVDVPLAAGFAFGGGSLVYLLAKPTRSSLARLVGVALSAFAILNWVAGFFGWYGMLQKVRISMLLLAILVLILPAFAGSQSKRLRITVSWGGFILVLHWLITAINTPSTLVISAPPFLGGFTLTFAISYYVVLASFPLGVLLALARTSDLPLFRMMSTAYIEVFRGIPLITILFLFTVMLPLFLPRGMTVSDLAAVFAGYSIFSAAYLAENVRGGLQSIRQGQYEAANALGLTVFQRTLLIVLPQGLRVSIPNLVGQGIATLKETSLIAIIGGFDLLRIANSTIPNQPQFLGQKRPALLFVAMVYFILAYTMSKSSQRLERRLDAGRM